MFLLITLTAFAIACRYFSVSERYKRNGDLASLRCLLSTRIRPGDSLERVVSILGPGELDGGRALEVKLWWQSSPDFLPGKYPDGFEKNDVMIHYKAGPVLSYALQFRNGKLVNHNPEHYLGSRDYYNEQ